MTVLIVGLVLFLGTHWFTTQRAARAAAIERLGAGRYKGLYSALVAVGLVSIIIGYGQYRASGYIPVWHPPQGLSHLALLLMAPVFVLLSIPRRMTWLRARTKHPMLLGVKLWALAHLLANGDLGTILLAGGFLAWAVAARVSLVRRERDEGVPDRSGVRFGLPDGIAIGGGLAVYVVFAIWLHPLLIGVSVIATR
ncbi:MAG: NnrU family protein [Alphaproteobacteria bacterium]|nr:NnrU family protein [Alphaproteobacteria bacterium]